MASIPEISVRLTVESSDAVATLALLKEAAGRLFDYANVLEKSSHVLCSYDTRECAMKLQQMVKGINSRDPKPTEDCEPISIRADAPGWQPAEV